MLLTAPVGFTSIRQSVKCEGSKSSRIISTCLKFRCEIYMYTHCSAVSA